MSLKQQLMKYLNSIPNREESFSDPFSKTSQPIIPDFILELTEDGFDLHLNSQESS